jgi:GTP-binding protein
LGYRNEFIVDTKGKGIICSHFLDFKPWAGEVEKTSRGSMISMIAGKALAFSLWNLQNRGTLYISPNVEVYEGMILGNTAKGQDLTVNPIKGKQLTNVRAAGSDEAIKLSAPVEVTLENGLSIIKEDEYLEITPSHIRLRKKCLTELERSRSKKKK